MTPILRYPGRRGKNLSMSAICCYRPDGSEARLAFGLREGAYDAPSLVRQLDLLSSVLGGDPAIVIWDNLNVHKSHEMRAFVAAQAWLEVAWLPPYAPELNPAEGLWANLKSQELANHAAGVLAPDPLAPVNMAIRDSQGCAWADPPPGGRRADEAGPACA